MTRVHDLEDGGYFCGRAVDRGYSGVLKHREANCQNLWWPKGWRNSREQGRLDRQRLAGVEGGVGE